MPKFFVTQEQIKDNKILIIGQDVNHVKNVLRKKVGEELIICDKDNCEDYLCKICELNEKQIECEIINTLESDIEPITKVTIFQGLPKSNKMELIIQKAVELGAYDIIPVEMKRCVVKLDEKDKTKKIQRWQKISEVAAKQCGRNIIPKINNIVNIKNICNLIKEYDIVLLAYENEKQNTIKKELQNLNKNNLKIAVIVGPEGGISEEEFSSLTQNGAISVTLGKRILRTETVAINILSIIMYELED